MPPAAADDLDARRRFALEAAIEAGARTLSRFDRPDLRVDTKGDGSPVTEADRDAERFLREQIEARFPDDGILGEEFEEKPGDSRFRWILDPIDGTKAFVHGVPLYGALVAVEVDRVSVIGVIRMPGLDETVYAWRGGGAWRRQGSSDPVPARVSTVDRLQDALLCTTAFDYFLHEGREQLWFDLARAFGATRGWSDCYAHVLLATGRVEAVIEPAIKPWDVAPTTVIIEEAGGRCTDWTGRPTAHAPNAIATNGRLHEAALEIISR